MYFDQLRSTIGDIPTWQAPPLAQNPAGAEEPGATQVVSSLGPAIGIAMPRPPAASKGADGGAPTGREPASPLS